MQARCNPRPTLTRSGLLVCSALLSIATPKPAPGVTLAAVGDVIGVPSDYPTIQEAIEAASDGDVVLVDPGSYPEHTVRFLGKAITVTGTAPDDSAVVAATIVDGGGQGTVFLFDGEEGEQSLLQGITITGGRAAPWPSSHGGGVTCRPGARPTLSHCIIRDNVSESSGGGVRCFEADPLLRKCTLQSNSAAIEGGGVYCDASSAELHDCRILANSALYGGGVSAFWESSPVLLDCELRANHAWLGGGMTAAEASAPWVERTLFAMNEADSAGGALDTHGSSTKPTLRSCVFEANLAEHGGAVAAHERSKPSFEECLFERNSAGSGGAAWGDGRAWYGGNLEFLRCTFLENRADHGGGVAKIEMYADATFTNCTLVGNVAGGGGGGISAGYDTGVEISSCILWRNLPDDLAGRPQDILVRYSDLRGSWGGEGNIYADPLFCDTYCGAYADLALATGSPCLGTGEGGSDMGSQGWSCDEPELEEPSVFRVPTDHATIQAAIDVSCEGDTVIVEPGTYVEHDIDLHDRRITVRGTAPGDSATVAATVVDGDSLGTVFVMGELADSTTLLTGLTIRGGLGGEDEGGGITISSVEPPTIRRCVIEGNSASRGGGVLIRAGSALIEECELRGNVATSRGGAVAADGSGLRMRRCTIEANTSRGDGGGVALFQSWGPPDAWAEIEQSVIIGNQAEGGSGGGVWIDSYGSSAIRKCRVNENVAANTGGGVYIGRGTVVIEGSRFRANSTSTTGGAIYGSWPSEIEILRCHLVENSAEADGGGAWIEGGRVDSVLVRGNSAGGNGGGLWLDGGLHASLDLRANTAGGRGGGLYALQATVSHSRLEGNESAGRGGGAYSHYSDFVRCEINGNTGGAGGGACMYAGSATACTIVANRSTGRGGGLYSEWTGWLENCVVAANEADRGGGLYCAGQEAKLVNSTFADNRAHSGGGIFYTDTSRLIAPPLNCILWRNAHQEIHVEQGELEINYSLVRGGWPGEGNLDADPRFARLGPASYLLHPRSPCVDAGDPAASDSLWDWHPDWPERYPNGLRSDMGAYGGEKNYLWLMPADSLAVADVGAQARAATSLGAPGAPGSDSWRWCTSKPSPEASTTYRSPSGASSP